MLYKCFEFAGIVAAVVVAGPLAPTVVAISAATAPAGTWAVAAAVVVFAVALLGLDISGCSLQVDKGAEDGTSDD